MATFNQVTLVGNLTRDPEMKYAEGGGEGVANCGIALNERWRDRDGNQKEKVTFVDFVCFGRTAETLNEYCKKGKLVLLSGKLQLDQWDDRETGQKRSKLKVVVFGIQFLGGREDGQQEGGGQRQQESRGGDQDRGGGQGRDDDRRARSGDGVDQGRGGNAGRGGQSGGNQANDDFSDIPF